jgi:hypothetical protein
MKALFAVVVVIALPTAALADESCYQLSTDGKAWSKTPELLCVSNIKGADYTLTVKSGLAGMAQELVTMRLSLVNRVKCLDCNQDVFGVASPSNSVANALAVKFNGKRDIKTTAETGTVTIGNAKLHYRSVPSATAKP